MKFADAPGFCSVVPLDTIRAKDGNLSIPLYVESGSQNGEKPEANLVQSLSSWLESSRSLRKSLHSILSE